MTRNPLFHPVTPAMRRTASDPLPLPLLGWREWVHLPGFGQEQIKAKVDTGARSSALHALDIDRVEGPHGTLVHFTILPRQKSRDSELRISAPLVDRRQVRSSSGTEEFRPVVRILIEIGGIRWPIEVTLTRRDRMGFRMLLGRTAIRGRFLVDPGRSFIQGGSGTSLSSTFPDTEGPPE
jgi:hypothetical protein